MKPFKIGVLCESFRLPVKEGVRKARELGVEGVQIYVADGPGKVGTGMSARERSEFKAFCKGEGLAISALCGGIPGMGLEDAAEKPEKIVELKKAMQLAADLGVSVLTTHIGVIPDEAKGKVYDSIISSGREIGRFGEQTGVTMAIETGPETAKTLKRCLDDIGSKGVGVNLDPANLAMVTGDDPVQAVHLLGKAIVHTHAKDGKKLQPCDAKEIYHAFALGGFAALEKRMGKLFEEVPLGQGQVKWDAYLQALADAGFKGFLTIEREVGADPATDIAEAVKFLRTKLER
ncbi:MAG: sugar phosphate isomerase/epimerase [Verrucomicrobiae bacterium]|nr:sugar phosphate isomerase/epimerase [Verrucomicrobiae bacterium]